MDQGWAKSFPGAPRFVATHRLLSSTIDLRVQKIGEGYFRQSAKIKNRIVCYVDEFGGELTCRTVSEFNRMFEAI